MGVVRHCVCLVLLVHASWHGTQLCLPQKELIREATLLHVGHCISIYWMSEDLTACDSICFSEDYRKTCLQSLATEGKRVK